MFDRLIKSCILNYVQQGLSKENELCCNDWGRGAEGGDVRRMGLKVLCCAVQVLGACQSGGR